MCLFSHQISFTSSAWHALAQNSSDPLAWVRGPVESLGGNLLNAFFTGDTYHVLAITEFPEAVSSDDISIAFYAGGAVARVHSSPLLTVSQANDAKRNATQVCRLTPRSQALTSSS
jgi:uncharacterized protein with GYD domain